MFDAEGCLSSQYLKTGPDLQQVKVKAESGWAALLHDVDVFAPTLQDLALSFGEAESLFFKITVHSGSHRRTELK